jgi:hypothetical protein
MAAKSKLNAAWHKENRMPQNATVEQRIAWHTEHRKHCGCRAIPEKLKAEMKKRNMEIE